jgi:hypothetical protein
MEAPDGAEPRGGVQELGADGSIELGHGDRRRAGPPPR